MKSQGLIKCDDAPESDNDLTNKKYVDLLIAASGINGGVFVTDLTPTGSGIVASKQYMPNTVPANKVILEGQTDTENVRVVLIAEGSTAFYSPTVTVETVPPRVGFPKVATLVEDQYDKRLFNGYVDITGVSADVLVKLSSSSGAKTEVTIKAAPAGPALNSVVIGALPGSQTEAKAGDVVPVTAKVENSAVYVEVISGGAASAVSSLATIGAADSGGAGYRNVSGTFVVGNGTGARSITVRARNAMGTYGANAVSSNTITLNQTFPAIASRSIAYPAGQTALKGAESATVTAAITNADTVSYSGVNLTVTDPSTYAAVKTVTRSGGTYVNGAANYTITATKASNGAVTTATAAVVIADAAPTAAISIAGNPSRLISTPEGIAYTVSVTANQTLSGPPNLSASSGTWSGGWTVNNNVYSRTLIIKDSDADGAQAFSGLVIMGLANAFGSTITSGAIYNVGGFTRRTLTFAAFSQKAAIGTDIATFAKVTARYGGTTDDLTRRTDTSQFVAGFTITDSEGVYNPNGGYLFITDAGFAGSNTTGTLQVEIEEVQ